MVALDFQMGHIRLVRIDGEYIKICIFLCFNIALT